VNFIAISHLQRLRTNGDDASPIVTDPSKGWMTTGFTRFLILLSRKRKEGRAKRGGKEGAKVKTAWVLGFMVKVNTWWKTAWVLW
jgi:hypothetical protein